MAKQLLLFVLMAFICSCVATNEPMNAVLTHHSKVAITSLDPDTAAVGELVTIHGAGFGNDTNDLLVKLGLGNGVKVISMNDSVITVIVSQDATNGSVQLVFSDTTVISEFPFVLGSILKFSAASFSLTGIDGWRKRDNYDEYYVANGRDTRVDTSAYGDDFYAKFIGVTATGNNSGDTVRFGTDKPKIEGFLVLDTKKQVVSGKFTRSTYTGSPMGPGESTSSTITVKDVPVTKGLTGEYSATIEGTTTESFVSHMGDGSSGWSNESCHICLQYRHNDYWLEATDWTNAKLEIVLEP